VSGKWPPRRWLAEGSVARPLAAVACARVLLPPGHWESGAVLARSIGLELPGRAQVLALGVAGDLPVAASARQPWEDQGPWSLTGALPKACHVLQLYFSLGSVE
jgi:hypothetical protein